MTHLHTPDDARVFVFGSNLAGIHGAGAAQYAHRELGAEWGRGLGMTRNGRAFALPTKDHRIQTLPLEVVARHVRDFTYLATVLSHLRFFVSEVGCGLAGFRAEQIAPLFRDAPQNCDLPPGWRVQESSR